MNGTGKKRRQCTATTKKGTQCKLNALPDNKVCHVHLSPQQKPQAKDKPAKPAVAPKEKWGLALLSGAGKETRCEKPGYIYVFTYAHMMHACPVQKPYLHSAGPTDNNWIDYKKVSPLDTSQSILIKVGYTRKGPEKRVNEWREKCGHSEFIMLYPGCLVPVYQDRREREGTVKNLSTLLKRLTISRTRAEDKNAPRKGGAHTGKTYTHLNPEKTCFVSSNPYQAEQRIHRILRSKYGTGKMYCEGCARSKVDSNNRITTTAGVHTEWFLVPRIQMHDIWDIIESQCFS